MELAAIKQPGSFEHHFECPKDEYEDEETRIERERLKNALSLVRLPDHVTKDNPELFQWAKNVLRQVEEHITLIVDPGKDMSQAELTAAIRKTPAGRVLPRNSGSGKESDYVGCWSRHGVGFESNARPAERLPPCQERRWN